MTLADLQATLLCEIENDAPEQDIDLTMHLLKVQYPDAYHLALVAMAAGIRDAHTTH